MTVTPLGRDQDCSLKIREPDVPAPWFLDPGGWSKTAAVSLYFIFPGICTLSLSEVVTTQTLCKEERLSLIDKIRSLESCVSEEHNRWYDSMKNLESQAREEVHSLEQTLCARLQALEETLCKYDKEPNKQKGKTIKIVTSPNGSNPMAYPVIIHERPADDTHPEPYVTHTLQPISIRDFKNMKEAIVTYGIHSTYVKQMLNSWSTSNRIIPDDWHQLTSAVLEYSQQLQWKSWLREEARNLEQQGSISNLLGIMGIPKDGLQNLANTLEGDKDLNSPRELSAEAEKELAIVEKTIREAHVDRVNPELKCILVILPSRHSPTGILMQREDVILEWIFLPRKPNKKLKTYIEKISDLIHKGKSHEITAIWFSKQDLCNDNTRLCVIMDVENFTKSYS
ncbi:hypothetical protein STEG23_038232 [Scotinomys teguina]